MRHRAKPTAVLLLLCCLCATVPPVAEGAKGGRAGGKGKAGVSSATVVASGGGESVTVGQLLPRVLSPLFAHWGSREELKAEVGRTAEGALRESLVLQAIRKSGFDNEIRAEILVIRDRFIALSFRRNILAERMRPNDEELQERLPRRWVRMKLQELTLPDRVEAEKARALALADPGRFTEMIREESIGPRSAEDGFTNWIEPTPFNFIFTPGQNEQVFSLGEGEFSPVIESGLGHTIYRVVRSEPIPPAAIEEKKNKLRGKIAEERIADFLKRRTDEARSASLFETNPPEAYRMVLEYLNERKLRDDEVVRVGDFALTFRQLTKLEGLYKWPVLNLTEPVPYFDRLRQMARDYIVPDHVLANAASAEGFSLDPSTQKGLDSKVDSWLGDRFYEERVAGKIPVTEEEEREFYERRKETFRVKEKVDLRYMRTGSRLAAKEASERMKKAGGFDAGWEWAGSKKNGKEWTRKSLGEVVAGEVEDNTVRNALSGLSPAGYSGVIPEGGKYYIVSLDKVREWREIPFDSVRQDIRRYLENAKRAEAIRSVFAEYYPDLRIELNDEAIDFLTEQASRRVEGKSGAPVKKAPPGHP